MLRRRHLELALSTFGANNTQELREPKRTGEAESEVRTRIDRDPIELAKIAAVAVDALALTRPLDREDVLRRLEKVLESKKEEPEIPQ